MMKEQFEVPILLICFNRPEYTKRVIDSIAQVRPIKLYISIDGPRKNNLSDEKNIKDVIDIIKKKVIWECQLKVLENKTNLGCKRAVYSAISWFFEFNDQGIILEDDTLPSFSFFEYCKIGLNYFQNDIQIGMLSGSNLLFNRIKIDHTYNLSNYGNIWGWATWKSRWEKFDLELLNYYQTKNNVFNKFKNVPYFTLYWKLVYSAVKRNKIDTWDLQWFYYLWEQDLRCVIPKKNLVLNIGFGNNSTHTNISPPDYILENGLMEMDFSEFSFSSKVEQYYDYLYSLHIHKISLFTSLKFFFSQFILSGNAKKILSKIWVRYTSISNRTKSFLEVKENI